MWPPLHSVEVNHSWNATPFTISRGKPQLKCDPRYIQYRYTTVEMRPPLHWVRYTTVEMQSSLHSVEVHYSWNATHITFNRGTQQLKCDTRFSQYMCTTVEIPPPLRSVEVQNSWNATPVTFSRGIPQLKCDPRYIQYRYTTVEMRPPLHSVEVHYSWNATPVTFSRGTLQLKCDHRYIQYRYTNSWNATPVTLSRGTLQLKCDHRYIQYRYTTIEMRPPLHSVQLRAMCPVCGQQPANRTHNPQLHTITTTWKTKHQIRQAANTCIRLSSSWWWA